MGRTIHPPQWTMRQSNIEFSVTMKQMVLTGILLLSKLKNMLRYRRQKKKHCYATIPK